MRRSVFSLVVAGAASLALAGCSSATLAGLLPLLQGQVNGQLAASLVAHSLLNRVTLPPGSSVLTASPVASLNAPPERTGLTDLATATRFAAVPLGAPAFLQFETTHPPTGKTTSFSGSGSAGPTDHPSVQWLSDNISGMAPGVVSATILISADLTAGTASQADVRVDAQVAWLPPKPAGLTVPPADAVAIVSIVETEPPQPSFPVPAPRLVRVTDPATVASLRSAADGLPSAYPGVIACPNSAGTEYTVAFAPAAADPPDITFTDVGCGYVDVTTAGGGRGVLGLDARSPMLTERCSVCRLRRNHPAVESVKRAT